MAELISRLGPQADGDQTTARLIQALQEELAKAMESLTQNADLDKVALEDQSISTGTTLIAHGLGRAWQGWRLTDKQGAGDVYRDTSSTADSTEFLALKASSTVTVDLEIW